jgi:hypothetical protein
MRKTIMLAAICAACVSTPASAQGTASVVEILQRDGAISFAAIREARGQQFDLLDQDSNGGLTQEEAAGALSIAGGRQGAGQMGGAGQKQGARRGGGAGMTEEQRAKIRERRQQRGMGRGDRHGQQGQGQGRRGAMMQNGGNPLEGMQFMSADGDFNGELSKVEFVEAPFPLLVSMDKDMDSRLTVEEIQAAPGRGGGMQGG